MKRLFGGILVAILGIATILAVPLASVGAANLNNFTITNYDIQYELSKDSENRSVLKANETIVADFKVANQNRGIERAIPKSYDSHSVSLKIDSVTDENGKEYEYSTSTSNSNEVLRIGNPDKYVSGEKTYKISYTQRDVTRFYADVNKDEWYWDTNGTQWRVPIEQLRISIKIDDALTVTQQGAPACYQGYNASAERCTLEDKGNGSYEVTASNLRAGQNITVAYGFTPDTFAQYQQSLFEKLVSIWLVSLVVTSILGVIALIWIIILYYRLSNRTKELHTVPVQYIPPKNASVMVSAQVLAPLGSVFSAQLMDFAVRHFISIIETKPKGTWTMAEYDILILKDPTQLLEEEQEILSDMFGSLPKVGDRLALSTLRNNTSYYKRTTDNDKKLKTLIEGKYGLRHKSAEASKALTKWAIALLIVGLVTLSFPLLFIAGITAIMAHYLRPLTDAGLEVRRYLMGLNTYIKAAEAERIKFLQAPDTADKVGEKVDTENPGQILKLYERVLPYAVLFGHEKEWTKRLGDLYQSAQSSPDWYSGSSAFNAVVFASAMSSFSSAASYSGGSSSSSGGSSGGGSSGGGGGGGGGGGW